MQQPSVRPADEELDEPGFSAEFTARVRRWCLWSWPVCLIGAVVGFAALAGFIPPPGADWDAARVAAFYAEDRTLIRVGLIVAMFFSALLLPFLTLVSTEIRRIEGRRSLLAPIQFGGAIVLVAFFQIICLLWLEASFRPDNNDQLVRAMNDYGWLVWTMLIPTGILQFLAIAVASFGDRSADVVWPRWAAYANVWVAITYGGGVLAVFFKTGPFSWTGLVGFWVPTVLWAAGMTMNMVLIMRRDARRSVAAPRSAGNGVAQPVTSAPLTQ